MKSNLISHQQKAKEMGINERTLYRYVRENKIRFVIKHNGRLRWYYSFFHLPIREKITIEVKIRDNKEWIVSPQFEDMHNAVEWLSENYKLIRKGDNG